MLNPLHVVVKKVNERENADTPDSDVLFRTLRDDVKEEVKAEGIEENNHGFTQDSFPLYSSPIVPLIQMEKNMEVNVYPKERLEESTLCQDVAGTCRMIPHRNDIGHSLSGRTFNSEDERLMAVEGIDPKVIKCHEQHRTLTSHPGVFTLPNQRESFIFTYNYLDVKTVDYLITKFPLGPVFATKVDELLFLGDSERELLWYRRRNLDKKMWLRKLFHVWFRGECDITWKKCVEAIDRRVIERMNKKNKRIPSSSSFTHRELLGLHAHSRKSSEGVDVDEARSRNMKNEYIKRMSRKPLTKMAAAFGLKSNVMDCPFCEETMGISSLNRHLKEMHYERRERLFGCTNCDLWYKSERGAFSHKERKGCMVSIRSIEVACKAEKLVNTNAGEEKMAQQKPAIDKFVKNEEE